MARRDITVLVPAFRHRKTIADAIASIAQQSVFDECRVIVSDDVSNDDTYEEAQRAAAPYPNIEVRRNPENLGTMNHYRHLMRDVNTAYVAILEGDDIWISEGKLERQRRFLQNHPDVGMCFTACLVSFEELRAIVPHSYKSFGRSRIIDIVDLIYDNPVATFSNCLYRAAVFRKVLELTKQTACYDWLCAQLAAVDGGVGFLAEPATLYRVHGRGTWSGLSLEERNAAIRTGLEDFRRLTAARFSCFVDDALDRCS
jgi:glycosyltransferase involved in cell wall biosynthesis